MYSNVNNWIENTTGFMRRTENGVTSMRASQTKIALVVLTTACSLALAQSPPIRFKASVLVDSNGRSLYTFDRDPENKRTSVCYGPCATNWPPLRASSGDKGGGEFSIIERTDGIRQWVFKGKPLYYWRKDQKPGDTKGDGIYNVWHLAREER